MKIALCGAWHVHAGQYIDAAKRLGEVVGVFDENEERCRCFCENKQVPRFGSFEELLKSDADGVIVCTATNRHTEYILSLISAGKNIFTEKVLALTVADCEKIEEALEKNGVNFVISFPHRYLGGVLSLREIVDSGELGRINYMRFRNCHSGITDGWLPAHFCNAEQCGGGAMIDLGAHGMYLTDWILGKPSAYTSVFTHCTGKEIEDNAVTVMKYENGAVAVNETGFVSAATPVSLEVGGEAGFVRYTATNPVSLIKCTKATGGKTQQVEVLPNQPSPIEQFLTDKILPGCGIVEAKRLTEMMEGAYAAQINN